MTIAETAKPTLLFEAGLSTRGRAEYWSLQIGGDVRPDVAWSYRTPLPESQKIAGLVSFYDEKVDLYVDGMRQDRASRG